MSISKDALRVLDYLSALGNVPPDQLSVEAARARSNETAKLNGEPEPVARWEERHVPGTAGDIPIRVYWPRPLRAEERIPVILFLHGGGWVLGNGNTYDTHCRRLANAAECVVVFAEYRLAPEHASPLWTMRMPCCAGSRRMRLLGGDRRKIAVAGDSAGGNLSASLPQIPRSQWPPPFRPALIYPVTDHWDAGYLSYVENAENYGLTRDLMKWFWRTISGGR